VTIKVTDLDSTLTSELMDAYEYYEEEILAPIITGISLNKGLITGGELITIYGKNFGSNLEVLFGSIKATITSKNDSVIIVTVPANPKGLVTIKVTDLDSTLTSELMDAYEYYEEEILAPIITGISLNKGLITGGELITIYGKNFGSNLEVLFGSIKATITSKNDSVIIVTVPANPKGLVTIKVTDLDSTLTSELMDAYEYYEEENKTIVIQLNPGVDTIEIYSFFIDKGAKAYYDTVELNVEVESDVNTAQLGLYQVIYKAQYGDLIAMIVRNVTVIDETAPTIILNSGIDTIYVNEDWVDSGVIVSDNSFESIDAIVSGSVNNQVPGTYVIRYIATDASNNTSFVERYVTVLNK
ncbi:MAG: IPT/TIG domain-containing protein, partial [Vulcanibacillus sp.]